MTYFLLEKSFEPAVVGVRDGLNQLELDRDGFSEKNLFDYYLNHFLDYGHNGHLKLTRFPDVDFSLQCVRYRPGAKKTDIMTFGPGPLCQVVNEKVSRIFQQYRLAPFKMYPPTILSRDGQIDESYKFFYCPNFGDNAIDFKQSVFSRSGKRGERTLMTVESQEEFKGYNEFLRAEMTAIKHEYFEYDLFNILMVSSTIISERLKNKLIEEKVKGIEIRQFEPDKFMIV